MTSRAYDFIIKVSNAYFFTKGNVVYGTTSGSSAEIIERLYDPYTLTNNLKVKVSNTLHEFFVGETLQSNTAYIYTVNTFIRYTNANYAIGVSNTYTLPAHADFKSEVIVYADNILQDSNTYNLISNTTIMFNEKYTLSANGSYVQSVYPGTNVANVIIQVVRGNTYAASYTAPNLAYQITTASSTISSIWPSGFNAEKNSFEQSPIVKLYSIYYPGDWYPPTANGNPTLRGAGYPWPYKFPYRYAEIVGENFSDVNYSITFKGDQYIATPIESDNFSIKSDGSLNEISLTINNTDGIIAALIENPFLAGNNNSNATVAYVRGERVVNIDPRTVSNNALFNVSVTALRGSNATLDYDATIALNGNWNSIKTDSRDLLGAIVEIQTIFANHLDYWPEYSLVRGALRANAVEVYTSTIYRIGDQVRSNLVPGTANVVHIDGNLIFIDVDLFGDNTLPANSYSNVAVSGTRLEILNSNSDNTNVLVNTYRINRLDELTGAYAKFNLTDWTQYFKGQVPKRKFFKNSCPWVYKGVECGYPESGTGTIVGSVPQVTANGYFTVNNVATSDAALDICSKTQRACTLRKNLERFGGFINVGNEY